MKYTDGYILTNRYDRLLPVIPYAVAQEHSGFLVELLLRHVDRLDEEIYNQLGDVAYSGMENWHDSLAVSLNVEAGLCLDSARKLMDLGAVTDIAEEADMWLQSVSE
jgi:hypothetical protein